eukprot:2977908-Pyramimonas_sp.AAC.1
MPNTLSTSRKLSPTACTSMVTSRGCENPPPSDGTLGNSPAPSRFRSAPTSARVTFSEVRAPRGDGTSRIGCDHGSCRVGSRRAAWKAPLTRAVA